MDRTAKKHLMAIPVQPYTGDGSAFARVYTEKDILMLHLWNNGEFKGRHLVDKAGKYVAEIGGAMCIKKLEYQLNSSQRYECGWLDVEVSEEDEKTAHTFFGEYNNIGLLINRAESWYNKDQYSRKMDRKIDRINAKMALFEEQEEKIKEWYLREITPWEYAFKADGVYYCTACGETHTGDYKHLQRLKCSGKMVDIKETIRWVWMPYQPGKVYYRQRGETWWDTNPCNRRWDASYLYPEQAEEVLRKSGYEATQLWDIGKAELPINWIMKRKTPVYAQLCLTGLAKLAQQDAAKLNYYSYGGKIDLEGQTPEEVLGLDKNAIGRLKQLNGGTVILEWLQWKAKHPKAELKTETLKELERKRITPSRLGVMANLMSPRKCLNFLSRQKRSEYNRQPDLDIVNEYLKEWQTEIKKRLKARDKQLAAQSAQQRAEEMEQLKNGTERNRQLFDLLMNDLMEVGA